MVSLATFIMKVHDLKTFVQARTKIFFSNIPILARHVQSVVTVEELHRQDVFFVPKVVFEQSM